MGVISEQGPLSVCSSRCAVGERVRSCVICGPMPSPFGNRAGRAGEHSEITLSHTSTARRPCPNILMSRRNAPCGQVESGCLQNARIRGRPRSEERGRRQDGRRCTTPLGGDCRVICLHVDQSFEMIVVPVEWDNATIDFIGTLLTALMMCVGAKTRVQMVPPASMQRCPATMKLFPTATAEVGHGLLLMVWLISATATACQPNSGPVDRYSLRG